MRLAAVLGLDSAWTDDRPSGVALVNQSAGAWKCVVVAPSYEAFIQLACGVQVNWVKRARGSKPDPGALLGAADTLLKGQSVTLVTVDMPVSKQPIVGRRDADNAVSKEFGNRGCGTHTPSLRRPGPTGERLTRAFLQHGYSLAAKGTRHGASKQLIEIYPHPALLVLLKAHYRIPYKVNRTRSYWPVDSPTTRIQKLVCAHRKILLGLRSEIDGIELNLPESSQVKTLPSLKPYEDALDALVCAWVGIKYIQGRAKPYGDETAAIWIPE